MSRRCRLERLEDRMVLSGGVVTTSLSSSHDWVRPGLVQNVSENGQSVQKFVAAGLSGGIGGDSVLLRYNLDGTLDTSFGKQGGMTVTPISSWGDSAWALDSTDRDSPAGKLVTGCRVGGISDYDTDFALARYSANGILDTNFGTKGKVRTDFGEQDLLTSVLVVQPDDLPGGQLSGYIYAGGYTGTTDSPHRTLLARYTPEGKLDATFNSGVRDDVSAQVTVIQTWGLTLFHRGTEPRILQTGYAAGSDGDDFLLICYKLDGSLDTSFGSGGIVRSDLSALPSTENQYLAGEGAIDVGGGLGGTDRILVSGTFYSPASPGRGGDFVVACYDSNGTLDTTFGDGTGYVLTDFAGANDDVRSIDVDPASHRIAVTGVSNSVSPQFAVALYDSSGTPLLLSSQPLQATTAIGSGAEAYDIEFLADGRLIVAGKANMPGGSGSDVALACYMADTLALDLAFGPVIPSVSISDVSASEGNSGTTNFSFVVSLSQPSKSAVTLSYATANGSATTGGKDFRVSSGTLTFAQGIISQTLTVPVIGDTKVEPNETFFVNLSSALNATIEDSQGVGTILNDDPAPAAASSWVLAVDQVLAEGGPSGSDKILEAETVNLLLYG